MEKLYIYEHCPYCVRVLVFLGLSDINLDIIVLENDDEKTPISMVGVKSLPILEKSKNNYMKESLDIIAYLDEKYNKTKLPSYNQENQQIISWINKNKTDIYSLSMPRWVNMNLKEFATKSARDYFTTKKEDYIGSFEKILKNSNFHIKNIEKGWQGLEKILQSTKTKPSNSIDFMVLFSMLYGLTEIKEINWNQTVKLFMNNISKQAKIKLHKPL